MIAHIFDDLCTGCSACVAACPTHVLDASPDGRPVIARLDQCQTCFMCELYCEADALYVGPDQRGGEATDPVAIRASGHLGRLRRDYGWAGDPDGSSPLAEFWQLGPLLREGAQIAARRYAARSTPRAKKSDGIIVPPEDYNALNTAETNQEDAMKLSARNVLPATVKSVTPGAVDTEVVVELAPGIEVVSIITKKSAEKLGLEPGGKAYAIVKASNVMIGVD